MENKKNGKKSRETVARTCHCVRLPGGQTAVESRGKPKHVGNVGDLVDLPVGDIGIERRG